MGFSCGIVGLPNVGKSTIFSALTSCASEAANYPFCTIEPNSGVVPVPDPRLHQLANIAQSKRIIPTTVEFVDIAGLVKGASRGEGLGNQFLGHIRSVDALVHVVRCFDSEEITHVDGSVDPVRDVGVIETELMLADLESLERRIQKLTKQAKSGDKEAKVQFEVFCFAKELLEKGEPLRNIDDERKDFLREFITAKPILYVANVAEEAASKPEDVEHVKRLVSEVSGNVVCLSGEVEKEISELDPEARKEFLDRVGIEQSGLEKLANAGYKLLDLLTFFTAGEKECRAWTCRKGSLAPQAAGVIHSDFEKGFIRAEVISCSDFLTCNGEQGAKEHGKLRVEGKDYAVQDGDVMHFRFNV